jgi:hypothetical protein
MIGETVTPSRELHTTAAPSREEPINVDNDSDETVIIEPSNYSK